MLNGIVTIVGRPNVGKSTLFNRLTRTKKAITDDEPGVTRDRIYGPVYYEKKVDVGFMIVDTGGFETEEVRYQPFSQNIVWKQTKFAIEEADIVLLMLDAKAGVHPHDKELLVYLKSQNKCVIAIVNKIDGAEQDSALLEFYELGLDEILPLSAAFNRGIENLLKKIKGSLALSGPTKPIALPEGYLSVAIIGRPNAGKSSILNRLVGEERSLVSEVPGTTRDIVDTLLKYKRKSYLLIDTSGIRRRSKILKQLETFAVIRSMQAIDRSDIILVVIDASEGLSDQDSRLVNLAITDHKPIVVIVNKWDLVPQKSASSVKDYTKRIHEKLGNISFIPVICISCKENQRVHKIMDIVERLAAQYSRRVETAEVNRILKQIIQEHTPAITRQHGKRIKFYYATQVSAKPPTIAIFCNVAKELQASYQKYMNKKFQVLLGFDEVPVKLIFKPKQEKDG